MNLNLLLQQAMSLGASEIHVAPGLPPIFRVDGRLLPAQQDKLKPTEIKQLLSPLFSAEAEAASQEGTLNTILGSGAERFEVTLHCDSQVWTAAFQRAGTAAS